MSGLSTTRGINLPDEFHRQTLSGQHSDIRLRASSGAIFSSVNDAHTHWFKHVFEEAAETHVLPPNVEVVLLLQGMDTSSASPLVEVALLMSVNQRLSSMQRRKQRGLSL